MINKLSLFAQQVDHLDSVYMYIFRSTLFIYNTLLQKMYTVSSVSIEKL